MQQSKKTIKSFRSHFTKADVNFFCKAAICSLLVWAVLFLMFWHMGLTTARPAIAVSFLFNGLLFYIMIVFSVRKKAFSLDLMHALFLFSFLFFAPFLQYLQGKWCWDTSFSDQRILTTNLLFLAWVAVYYFAKNFRLLPFQSWRALPNNTAQGQLSKVAQGQLSKDTQSQLSKDTQSQLSKKSNETSQNAPRYLPVQKNFLSLCVFLSLLIAGYLFYKFGFDLFSRGTNDAFTFENSSLSLLVNSVVPAFVTVTTALAIFNVFPRGKRKDWALLFLQTIALVIVCFPAGMARYQTAGIYVGLILVLFPFLRKGGWFLMMMVFGLLIVFPALESFRLAAFDEVRFSDAILEIVNSFTQGFSEGHYDAYMMFMLIQEYVEKVGLSCGGQLLGALLFFVPRALWPGKPWGSGRTAAEFFGWDFSNLSCPLPAEGFVNFGVMGVVLFAFILGKAIRRLDNGFWAEKSWLLKLLYPFLLPFFFFMMRGDLMSSFAYTFGFCVTAGVLHTINFLLVKKYIKRGQRDANG